MQTNFQSCSIFTSLPYLLPDLVHAVRDRLTATVWVLRSFSDEDFEQTHRVACVPRTCQRTSLGNCPGLTGASTYTIPSSGYCIVNILNWLCIQVTKLLLPPMSKQARRG
ncbi:hypothetical protein CALVIDRAFT_541203 [Calocera viscosa TUFC12733]|uniref:Uncharacterized protein n=1 Tax=Calocera viscosa (strain TUFC12733) TaxID=1330018 RepID=A0A167I0R0_CALVF|nr:hypothetical protein CALVIDRAFT_541203 [Calocera viscosa TUFC12733]